MKKLLFSVIALVAFSGVSMASKKAPLLKLNCSNVWNIAYFYAQQQGFSTAEANTIAFAAYDQCTGCNQL